MNNAKPALQLNLSIKTLVVFQFLFFLMHELHEQAHMITGRLLCGAWGTRDFNVWRLSETCTTTYPQIATFAGPLFTFAMLWLGRYWLKYGTTTNGQSLGLVLIFGNMPFGRLYMAAMGSGDEVFGLRSLFINTDRSNIMIIRLVGFCIVLLACLPPLITAYSAILNKNRLLIFITLLIIPLVLDTVILLMLLNGLLAKGLLSQAYIMGTPLLINLWLVLCLAIVGINYQTLKNFSRAVQ